MDILGGHMILVTLGTQDKGFERLLKEIDKLIKKELITDKVIVQAGHTKYESKNMEIFDFKSQKELDKLRKEADLIISHAGVGSILDSLKYGKKVIGVARLKKYGEHTNDHQLQILEKFSNDGYIIKAQSVDKLYDAIEKSKNFEVKKYKSNVNNMIKIIDNYISNN